MEELQTKQNNPYLLIGTKKRWPKKKIIILFLIVGILIVVSCGIGYVLVKTDWIIKHNEDTNQVSAVDQSTLLFQQAVTYSNNGQPDEALTAALEADILHPTDNIEVFIARIYMSKDDKQNAIIYYQKAIENINQKDPMADSDKQDYQIMIDYLNGNEQQINE